MDNLLTTPFDLYTVVVTIIVIKIIVVIQSESLLL